MTEVFGGHGEHVARPEELAPALERALADANIDLVLERAYTKIACERAGIKDVEGFKKKHRGAQPT